jgi:hypothetical protein
MAAVPSVITYRRLGLRLVFSSEGIAMHPLFRQPIRVAWSEIDFVSAIPAAEQVDGAWRFRDFGLAPGWDILRDHGRFVLDIVVHDRHPLKQRLRWHTARLAPLATANDTPHARQGTFALSLRVRGLDAKPTDLLELVARHARFDLLCHGD